MKTLTRNKIAVFVDYVGFGVGLTFAHTGTVLPAFAATLTDSKILIGMVTAVWLGAWLLPQLFAASFLAGKPSKYNYMVRIAALGRPIFWLLAVILAFGWLADRPMVLLSIFLAGLAWFAVTDAIVAICWFDIFGKAMGPRDRGWLIGVGQVAHGLLAIAAGALVAFLLSDSGPAYPYNYAMIFTLAGAAFMISWLGSVFMVELPEAAPTLPAPTAGGSSLPRLWGVWSQDKVFSRTIVVRMLNWLSEMSAPFYIIHAIEVTRVGGGIVGSLAAVGSIGAALAGLWLGRVAARQGSQRVIQIITWLSVVPPLLGLTVALAPPSPLSVGAYVACYLVLGMVNGSAMLGFFNYILDLAPLGHRPIYMGLANTVGGLLVVAPIMGGWILDVFSYPVLFAVTFVGVLAGAVVALRLPPIARPESESGQANAPA